MLLVNRGFLAVVPRPELAQTHFYAVLTRIAHFDFHVYSIADGVLLHCGWSTRHFGWSTTPSRMEYTPFRMEYYSIADGVHAISDGVHAISDGVHVNFDGVHVKGATTRPSGGAGRRHISRPGRQRSTW